MTGPLDALLALDASANLFPPNSRYHGVELATLERADGTVVTYLRRRFVPPPERFALLQEHRVEAGERPDTLAAIYLGDPEQFWRLCDANATLKPRELTAHAGDVVRITLPEGIPGPPDG
jgi:hypothetical protein